MSIPEIVAQTQADCAALPIAELHAIAEWIDTDAAPKVYPLAQETHGPELPAAVNVLGEAREALDRTLYLLASAQQGLASYCQRITGGYGPGTPPSGTPGPSAPPDTLPKPTEHEPRITAQERGALLERRRTQLAVGVPGSRTTGVWVDAKGTDHELTSGNRDRWHTLAADFARQRGWSRGSSVLGLTRHVEIKFAMRMREMDATRRPGDPLLEETIVIDRPPCGVGSTVDWTCETRLPDFLPPGASLTVIDRAGNQYTYRGNDDQ